ncbi:MAG: hypothetical protein EKK37_12065 [Sphingobacteriales bacterium]|nr:MAG: hypothetical protein EKK37_12065 [Sphingobacteriales bacterium]
MARIKPLKREEAPVNVKKAFQKHEAFQKGRITNMKATLGHSLLSFEVYMQWYPLYEQVEKILGKRLAYLYAWSISNASDCPLCTTYFRKLIIDAGETPERLELKFHERKVVDFGSSIAKHHGNIADHVYDAVAKYYNEEELVVLIAFAGQMIATNIFNNVIETDIDEYLNDYLPKLKSIWKNE